MARIRTLSRTFLKGHPSEGMPTFFVEKFLNSRKIDYKSDSYLDMLFGLNAKNIREKKLSFEDIESFWLSLQPTEDIKNHTIRAGKHFKQGDSISIRCWFGKPYKGCQIILCPDVAVVKTYDFEMDENGIYSINGKYIDPDTYPILAKNDGLTEIDMQYWFMPDYDRPVGFAGQIIAWSNNINY